MEVIDSFEKKIESMEIAEEDKKIILDFCTTFQKVFSDFVAIEEFMKRISSLTAIQYTNIGDKCEAAYSQNGTLTINDDVHGNKRKSMVYHELMHLVSMHLSKENQKFGVVQGFKIGSIDFNEIMTEHFSTRLLLEEGINDVGGKYYITSQDGVEEYVEYYGTGYLKSARLGELYHKIFGDEIVDGYFNDAIRFQKMFNEKYKVIGDEEFTPMENAVSLSDDVYNNYGNALRVFMINEQEKLQTGDHLIYDYLADSKKIKECLPVRKDRSLSECETTGLPAGIEKYMLRLDEKFVAQYIRPDLIGKQQDAIMLRKKKDFFISLNAIRDNIDKLSPEDVENIEILSDGTLDNKTINISVNGKNIQVYTDGETYLGTQRIEEFSARDLAESFAREPEVVFRIGTEETKRVFRALEEPNRGQQELS